jgi:RimJ/RimL family protein N-acetyltransferase
MKSLFPIKGDKIILRPFTIKDSAAKKRIDKACDIREHLGCPSNLEVDIKEFQQQGYGLVAIVDFATGDVAGYAKLQRPEWQEGLGLELVLAVSPEARRKGMAREAAQKLIEIACGPLRQKQVVGRVALNNTASLNLVGVLGMKKVGEREDLVEGIQGIYLVACGKAAR